MRKIIHSLTLFFLLPVLLFSQENIIRVNPNIELIKLSEGFYMHTTFDELPGYGRFASNGLLIVKNGKAFMIDSPTTDETTRQLTRYLSDSLNAKLVLFTGGHFHNDCIGGMSYIKSIGAKTFLNTQTRDKCVEHSLPLPDTTYEKEYRFNFEGISVVAHLVGGGHTADNSIVYFPEQKIMFGGCLVKCNGSQNLGNLADAVVDEWKPTIEKIVQLYPSVEIIVPGHGPQGGKELLTLTANLVDRYLKEQ